MTEIENTTQTLFVSGVCCATEEAIVRKHLDALAGVNEYRFNPLTCELRLHDATKSGEAMRMLTKSGFPTRSKRALGQPQSFSDLHGNAVLTSAATVLAVTGIVGEQMEVPVGIVRGLLLCAIVIGGWRVFVKAWKSVRTYAFDMNVLNRPCGVRYR